MTEDIFEGIRNLNNPTPAIQKIDKKKDLISFFGDEVSQENFDNILYGEEKEQYKEFVINKATGKPRTLHAVPKKLKHIQRIALDRLQEVEDFKPSRHAHGFVLKRSIITNAIPHRRRKRVIKMDLKDFFPSIHEDRVRDMFMGKPFSFGEEAAITMAQLSCLNDGSGVLPQGGVLSPYVANMLCLGLDKKLAKVAIKHHCNFTRYADDITFSTNDVSEDNITNLIKETSNVIESEDFIVNTEKTKVLTPNRRQVVTGIIVNDGLNVNRRYIRNLRATIKNCELFGIDSQTQRFVFKDFRCSGPDKFNGSKREVRDYFLNHIFGKIIFFGNVVLSNNQGKKNKENSDIYKRVQTYEEILYRFYKLIVTVKTNQIIRRKVISAVNKRANLRVKLSYYQQGNAIRKDSLNEYRETPIVQSFQNDLQNIIEINNLEDFVQIVASKDPRFFKASIPADLYKAKKKFKKLLSFPLVDLEKTTRVLRSLSEDPGLKRLVHENNERFTANDCFNILRVYYDPVVYYLPQRLQEEFENWKDDLVRVVQKHGATYNIDVMHGEIISDATNKLKINTRFNGSPSSSSNLKKEIQGLVDNINLENNRVNILINNHIAFYTHTPSIIESIKIALKSMLTHTIITDTVFINLSRIEDLEGHKYVELIVFNTSTRNIDNELLSNRDFAHGKISDVVRLTNGLCNYYIEATLEDGERKKINMHNNFEIDIELTDLEYGFAHRFIFKR